MQKLRFLQTTRVADEEQAMSNSLVAALQHSRIYAENVGPRPRKELRDRWADLLRGISRQYGSQVDDNSHVQNISDVCDVLSEEFAPILYERRFRIGTSQKALNLYLRFLWCLDLNEVPPPHCPIDRTVLQKAEISGAWTKLDSCEVYRQWISKLQEYARANGYELLQQWEIALWNDRNP